MMAFSLVTYGLVLVCFTGYGQCGCDSPQLEVTSSTGPLTCGAQTTSEQVRDQPKIEFVEANENEKYTLLMHDPDAPYPGHTDGTSYLHWLMVDIQGDSLKDGKLGDKVIQSYTPPSPPSGTHRYKFVLYKQNGVSPSNDGRTGFDVGSFEKEFRLQTAATFEYRYTKDQ